MCVYARERHTYRERETPRDREAERDEVCVPTLMLRCVCQKSPILPRKSPVFASRGPTFPQRGESHVCLEMWVCV